MDAGTDLVLERTLPVQRLPRWNPIAGQKCVSGVVAAEAAATAAGPRRRSPAAPAVAAAAAAAPPRWTPAQAGAARPWREVEPAAVAEARVRLDPSLITTSDATPRRIGSEEGCRGQDPAAAPEWLSSPLQRHD
jgi:hypothetical protein